MFDKVTLKLNVDPLILSALREDITSEDVSANSVMRDVQMGEADLICKEDGIICGLQVFERVFKLLDEESSVEFFVKDGDQVSKGQLMAKLRGDVRVLLCGERTALNYLQRMSGVATYTRSMAQLLEGTKTKLVDTRKTTPNNRIFEKYAVKVGGGHNHRYNLSDGVMLKDNHIWAHGSITGAVAAAKAVGGYTIKIEVEVDSEKDADEAIAAGADVIMLDNFTGVGLKVAAQSLKTRWAGKDKAFMLECSGGLTTENVETYINNDIDVISTSAIHQGCPHVDFSLKIDH